ncbi:hypothetical protein PROFUN_12434 [Planoprotostelium fungivorum]|uniref:DEK-C domain-containing protein n=1 Tax=Planoprotostelium fungivorum TaxID=1890364 RepID=A0A2P6N5R8_9EUKA|nr:hypothetical protein PROFUN_12434 [Planoprotostelium fungivorum]
MATEEDIRKSLRYILKTNDVQLITPRQLRRQLEELLVLEDGCLDENKEQLSELVQKELVELHREESKDPPTKTILHPISAIPIPSNGILTDKEGQSYVNLGSNALRVTAKRLNGEKVLDIRKFERDGISKELKAAPEGIRITLEQYNILCNYSDQIQTLLSPCPCYRSQGSLLSCFLFSPVLSLDANIVQHLLTNASNFAPWLLPNHIA